MNQSVVSIDVDAFIIAMKAVRDVCTGAAKVWLPLPDGHCISVANVLIGSIS